MRWSKCVTSQLPLARSALPWPRPLTRAPPFILRQLGFRTKAVDFVQQWVFDPALFSPSSLGADKGGRITYLELLKIGHACLKSKEALIKERCVGPCGPLFTFRVQRLTRGCPSLVRLQG